MPQTNPPLRSVFLIASGAAFALFPMLRPWADKTAGEAGMVEAFGSSLWIPAHLVGAAGFVLFAAALASGSERRRPAAWLAGLGSALVLPFYGAESFGLHAVAHTAAADQVPGLAEAVRNGTWALGTFTLGLLVLAASGLLAAVDHWRTGSRHWAALPFALALAAYLPQYFLPPAGRVGHGFVLLAGAVLWAVVSRTKTPSLVEADA